MRIYKSSLIKRDHAVAASHYRDISKKLENSNLRYAQSTVGEYYNVIPDLMRGARCQPSISRGFPDCNFVLY